MVQHLNLQLSSVSQYRMVRSNFKDAQASFHHKRTMMTLHKSNSGIATSESVQINQQLYSLGLMVIFWGGVYKLLEYPEACARSDQPVNLA